MKVWAKLIIEGKNIKDTLYENQDTTSFLTYESMLRDVSYLLDIPTPLALKSHYKHFLQFNINKFTPKFFIEEINFDYLELETYE